MPTIRPATPDDLDPVAAIYAHYVTGTVITFDERPPPVDHWRERLDDLTGRGLPFLVAEVGTEIVGYAYAAPWRPKPAYRYAVEDTVYLAPGWTGRGLGRALLSGLLDGCAAGGIRQVVAVIADSGGGASVGLHAALGFTTVGRLVGVGFKHGRWVDTVLMQRGLTGAT
jgi:phosphinothricin acetyltransferase